MNQSKTRKIFNIAIGQYWTSRVYTKELSKKKIY